MEEYLASVRIAMDSFGMSERDVAEAMDRAERDREALSGSRGVVEFLAWQGDEPVATGRATFTAHGVLLNGGSTLERARGRGAYRALVAARWREAERRGSPRLVTQAGDMSRPILARLGFREVCDIRILLDRAGDGREGARSGEDG